MNNLEINLSAEQMMTDRELLESIHVMLVNLTQQKTKTKRVPKARHEYDPEFEALWKAYPARNGSNPKWKAQQAWRARTTESMNEVWKSADNDPITLRSKAVLDMLEGVQRYASWCEATAKTGTEMVMQTARFLGPSREYANAWEPPKPETQVIKIPANGDELVSFAAKYGINPGPGESWFELRKRVETAVENSD